MSYPDGTHHKYNAWTEEDKCFFVGYTYTEYDGEDFETLEECIEHIKSVFIMECLECGTGEFDICISKVVEYYEDEKEYEHFATISKSEWLEIVYEQYQKQKRLIENMGDHIAELEGK